MFNNIYLKTLIIEGFKGYKEKKQLYFSDITKIAADNEEGKTTIGESITWAFLGTNLFGNDKVDSDFLNNQSKKMEVTVGFSNQGKDYILTRSRIGSNTTIQLNHKSIKQAELTAMLGSKDIFLSIFNPEYFNAMGDKDGRDFFITILPGIQIEDILVNIDNISLEYIKDDLELIHNDPNSYIQNKRSDIKSLESDLVFNEGVLSKLYIADNSKDILVFDTNKLEELEKEFDKTSFNNAGLDTIEYENLVEKKNILEKEIIATTSKEFSKIEILEEIKELTTLEKNISLLEMEKYEIPEEISSKILTLEAQYFSLREEYKKHQNTPLNGGDKCPKCKTSINHTHAKMLEDELISELNQLEVKGKEKSNELANLKKMIEQKEKDFNELKTIKVKDFNDKHNSLSATIKKIEESNKSNNTLFLEKKEKSIAALQNSVKQIEGQIIKLKTEYATQEELKLKEIANKKEELKKEIIALRQEKAKIDAYNLEAKILKETIDNNLVERNKLLEENSKINSNITLYKSQIEICKEYTNIKVKLLSVEIHSYLKDVTIELQKVVKSTGELKDCFDILYKGIKYKTISRSATIKVGLEISNLVRNITKYNYPLFVDNSESITKYEAPEGVQLIETKVVEGKALNVSLFKNDNQLSIAI